MSVTFSKLADRVDALVKDYPRSKVDTKTILRLAFLEVGNALAAGEDIFLEGFGRFYPGYRPTRTVKSGLTKSEHVVGLKALVRFTAFDKLNVRVQKYLVTLGIVEDRETEDSNAS